MPGQWNINVKSLLSVLRDLGMFGVLTAGGQLGRHVSTGYSSAPPRGHYPHGHRLLLEALP